MKRHVKNVLKLVLDSNGSPTALLVLIIKKPLHLALEKWCPDEEVAPK